MGLFSGWYLGSPKSDKFPIEQMGAKFPLTKDAWKILTDDNTFAMNLYLSDPFLIEFVKHNKITQEEANTLVPYREILKDKEKFFNEFLGYIGRFPILLDYEEKSIVTLAWWLQRMVMINGYRKYKNYIDKRLMEHSKTKEPDMICWNCNKFISHKKVKWKPRIFNSHTLAMTGGGNYEEKLKLNKEIVELTGMKDEQTASPNQVFGLHEYEYRGKCPECNAELTCFWRGEKSFNEVHGIIAVPKPKPFYCNECEHVINRGFQVWYSIRKQEDDKIKEYLLTVCPKCHTEQGYPFEYDLERGIIE